MSSLPSFPPLQDPVSNDGAPWHLVAEGDAAAGKNAGANLVAKDNAGDLDYLNIDAQGRLITVGNMEDVIDLGGEGDNAGSASLVTLFDITLQASMDYKEMEWLFSCFREATFEIIHIADLGGTPVETVLGTVKVGAGSFTHAGKKTSRFTSGGVGVQVIRVRAINLNAISQLEACLSVEEVQ